MSVPYMMNKVKVAYAPLTQLRSGIVTLAKRRICRTDYIRELENENRTNRLNGR